MSVQLQKAGTYPNGDPCFPDKARLSTVGSFVKISIDGNRPSDDWSTRALILIHRVLCHWPSIIYTNISIQDKNLSNKYAKYINYYLNSNYGCQKRAANQCVFAGNTNLRGRLSTVDLLIKVACFVKKKVISVCIIKSS